MRKSCWPAIALALWLLAPPPRTNAQTTLPGTKPFTMEGDPAAAMVDAINSFLLRETAASANRRADLWKRDYRSAPAYERSLSPNRERLRRIIGAVDRRVPVTGLEFDASTAAPSEIATGAGYRVFAVRWPVFDDLTAEGLLLEPDTAPKARIVAIPDAGWSPEMLAGLAPGMDSSAQFARRLA